MNVFGNIPDWLKLSPSRFFAIALVTGLLLFAPSSFLSTLGVLSFVTQYRPFIGAVFLVSLALFLVHPLSLAIELIGGGAMDRLNVKSHQKWLHQLTEEEKHVLRGYIHNQTQTQNLDPQSGVTNGLVGKKIIYRAANIGDLFRGFAYNIQPWAWDYLNKHPELLERDTL